ncbi:MAG: 16S rRNA processing protein RimM [Acetobacteraceae bacterium]|nr:16S rRNA processing protein RimM [Acetobacteraceae bacterium]
MVPRRILLGVIGRPHGLRGLVHVHSYTADPVDLIAYGDLSDAQGRRFVLRWRGAGIAEISLRTDASEMKISDRDGAAKLARTELFIERDRLPAADEDEFYLVDLIGLDAFDVAGALLGKIASVHDYGAGASLEIACDGTPLVIPFTRAAVPEVDIAAGRLVVDPPVETIIQEPDSLGEAA